ncbi:MAG: hypothetical protein ACOYKE_06005, partial [Ferruginibacter sp.]
RGIDWVSFTTQQVAAAFRLHKPAIISTHRVNYCGQIDPSNRTKGLKALKALLHQLVKKWPDLIFMSAPELGQYIRLTQQG